MEGEVGVSSEPGQGATFWTRFPARALAPPPEERPLSGRTIIIASDSAIRREALRLKAEALGGVALETETLYGIETLLEDAQGPATLNYFLLLLYSQKATS